MPAGAGLSYRQRITSAVLTLLLGDLMLLSLSFILAFWLRHQGTPEPFDLRYGALLVVLNLAWLGSGALCRLYTVDLLLSRRRFVYGFVKALGLLAMGTFALLFAGQELLSRSMLAITFGLFAVSAMAHRFLVHRKTWRRVMTAEAVRTAILIGNPKRIGAFQETVAKLPAGGFRTSGEFAGVSEEGMLRAHDGRLIDPAHWLKGREIHALFCLCGIDERDEVSRIARFAERHGIRFRLLLDFQDLPVSRLQFYDYGVYAFIGLRPEPLEQLRNQLLKRGFDLAFSLLVIAGLLSWLIPLVALIIKLTSRGPVFFLQERTGLDGQTFRVLKFCSMEPNADAHRKAADPEDERLTPLGRFLRRSSIDELPQFFNVLAGHMSVVGPRPHMLEHTDIYSRLIGNYMVRHLIQPGITGWAQVNGYRGSTDEKSMRERVALDVWYIENWSFLLDLRIIFRTARNLLRGEKNAY